MKVVTFDVETTTKNTHVGEFKAHFAHPRNKIVQIGHKTQGCSEVWTCRPNHRYHLTFAHNADLLVGHNITFDLLYTRKTWPDFDEWLRQPSSHIWDTQQVEYLITGQLSRMASLDSLSVKYGGEGKDDVVGRMIKEGIDPEKIDPALLQKYLTIDVEETERVFEAQWEIVQELGMWELVATQNNAIKATTEMLYNGMCFDYHGALHVATELERELDKAARAVKFMFKCCLPLATTELKPGSNDILSKVLFGGRYKYKLEHPMVDNDGNVILYKSGLRKGEIRYKKYEKEGDVETFGLLPLEEWKTKKEGVYRVDDEVLTSLLGRPAMPPKVEELINTVLRYRSLKKDYTTYFQGYRSLAWPKMNGGDVQHFIHGNLNHNTTRTGRLSSSAPNLQNLSGDDG